MQERKFTISEFILKVVAFVTMTFDHVGIFLAMYDYQCDGLAEVGDVFRTIGRLAFPLFMFMLVEGMRHTRSKPKYVLRLALPAAASMIGHAAIFFYFLNTTGRTPNFGGNPMLDLLINGAVLICLSLKGWKKAFALVPFAYSALCSTAGLIERSTYTTVLWLPEFVRSSYGIFGTLLVIGFFFAKPLANLICRLVQKGIDLEEFEKTDSHRKLVNVTSTFMMLLVVLLFWILKYATMDASGYSHFDPVNISQEAWCLISAVLILLYNGKRGYDSKWFRVATYSYFPAHLVIIFLVFGVIFGF